MMDEGYVEFLQFLCVTNPRQHEKLRRVVGARREHDFATCQKPYFAIKTADDDAGGLFPSKLNAHGFRITKHFQISSSDNRMNERPGAVPALTILLGDLPRTESVLHDAIEVAVSRVLRLFGGREKGARNWIQGPQRGHVDFAARAVQRRGATLAVFLADECGQDVRPAPARIALFRPLIIVARVATHVDHAVDGARSA